MGHPSAAARDDGSLTGEAVIGRTLPRRHGTGMRADGEAGPQARSASELLEHSPVMLVPGEEETSPGTEGNVSFNVEIRENDVRARQFACHLKLCNNTRNTIHVLTINYSLGSGVTKERSDNTSFMDLKKEYDQLRRDVVYLFRTILIAYSEDFRKEFARQFLQSLRSRLSLKNPLMAYAYLITRRFRLYENQMLQMLQRMDVPIASSKDARKFLDGLAKKGIQPSVSDLLVAKKISRMQAIEKIDRNFLRPEYVTQILPGESLEQVYILKAKRKLSSIASYTAAFDVKLAWEEAPAQGGPKLHVERMMSREVSFDVTPNPITLSILAVVFSILGTALNGAVSKQSGDAGPIGLLTPQDAWRQYFVAAVLAFVLYNSIEMTDLRNRFRSISWRSAMVVGLICGLLSDKMLNVVKALFGS
jgi:hypothetical protein